MPKPMPKEPRDPDHSEKSSEPEKSDVREEPAEELGPKFAVVEFTDGVNVVSSTWLSVDGKTCKWPHNKIGIPYNKLAQFHAVPTSKWIETNVIRNFGTYQQFDVAQKKFELALQFSDIDTDVDDLAAPKIISKKIVEASESDEDEIDLPPSPVAPSLQKSRANENKRDKVNGKEITQKRKSPTSSSCTSSISQCFTDKSVVMTNSSNSEHRASNSRTGLNLEHSKDIGEATSSDASNGCRLVSRPRATTSQYERDLDFPKRFINLGDENSLQSQSSDALNINLTNAKLQSIENGLSDLTLLTRRWMEKVEKYLHQVNQENGAVGGTPAAVLQELGTIFPLQTMAAFEEFEASLKSNPQRARDVVQLLRGIGGNSVDDAVRRMLRKVYTNQFAELFSWEGRKGKTKLCDLEITKLMLNALKSMPGMKEADFEKRVKEWFRHAKTRRQNEEKRVAKADA